MTEQSQAESNRAKPLQSELAQGDLSHAKWRQQAQFTTNAGL